MLVDKELFVQQLLAMVVIMVAVDVQSFQAILQVQNMELEVEQLILLLVILIEDFFLIMNLIKTKY